MYGISRVQDSLMGRNSPEVFRAEMQECIHLDLRKRQSTAGMSAPFFLFFFLVFLLQNQASQLLILEQEAQ